MLRCGQLLVAFVGFLLKVRSFRLGLCQLFACTPKIVIDRMELRLELLHLRSSVGSFGAGSRKLGLCELSFLFGVGDARARRSLFSLLLLETRSVVGHLLFELYSFFVAERLPTPARFADSARYERVGVLRNRQLRAESIDLHQQVVVRLSSCDDLLCPALQFDDGTFELVA